jgi:hypothetical protein
LRALLKARDENVEPSRKDPRSRAEPGEQFWNDTFCTLATARDCYRSIDEQLAAMNKTFREDLAAEASKLASEPINDEPPAKSRTSRRARRKTRRHQVGAHEWGNEPKQPGTRCYEIQRGSFG